MDDRKSGHNQEERANRRALYLLLALQQIQALARYHHPQQASRQQGRLERKVHVSPVATRVQSGLQSLGIQHHYHISEANEASFILTENKSSLPQAHAQTQLKHLQQHVHNHIAVLIESTPPSKAAKWGFYKIHEVNPQESEDQRKKQQKEQDKQILGIFYQSLPKPLQEHVQASLAVQLELDDKQESDMGGTVISPISASLPQIMVSLPGEKNPYDLLELFRLFPDRAGYRESPMTRKPFKMEDIQPNAKGLEQIQIRSQFVKDCPAFIKNLTDLSEEKQKEKLCLLNASQLGDLLAVLSDEKQDDYQKVKAAQPIFEKNCPILKKNILHAIQYKEEHSPMEWKAPQASQFFQALALFDTVAEREQVLINAWRNHLPSNLITWITTNSDIAKIAFPGDANLSNLQARLKELQERRDATGEKRKTLEKEMKEPQKLIQRLYSLPEEKAKTEIPETVNLLNDREKKALLNAIVTMRNIPYSEENISNLILLAKALLTGCSPSFVNDPENKKIFLTVLLQWVSKKDQVGILQNVLETDNASLTFLRESRLDGYMVKHGLIHEFQELQLSLEKPAENRQLVEKKSQASPTPQKDQKDKEKEKLEETNQKNIASGGSAFTDQEQASGQSAEQAKQEQLKREKIRQEKLKRKQAEKKREPQREEEAIQVQLRKIQQEEEKARQVQRQQEEKARQEQLEKERQREEKERQEQLERERQREEKARQEQLEKKRQEEKARQEQLQRQQEVAADKQAINNIQGILTGYKQHLISEISPKEFNTKKSKDTPEKKSSIGDDAKNLSQTINKKDQLSEYSLIDESNYETALQRLKGKNQDKKLEKWASIDIAKYKLCILYDFEKKLNGGNCTKKEFKAFYDGKQNEINILLQRRYDWKLSSIVSAILKILATIIVAPASICTNSLWNKLWQVSGEEVKEKIDKTLEDSKPQSPKGGPS